jgi:hypothetical protein
MTFNENNFLRCEDREGRMSELGGGNIDNTRVGISENLFYKFKVSYT